jgi:DisA bacterial checkpoint controller nucleotide-binding
VTEQTDSRCIIVSEETGSISFAEGGQIYRPLTVEQLKDLLSQRYSAEQESLTSPIMPSIALLTKRFLSPSSNSRTGE